MLKKPIFALFLTYFPDFRKPTFDLLFDQFQLFRGFEASSRFPDPQSWPSLIDLLKGLFRGAVFRHGGGALKQPIKEPTETPTSTLALMGRFPLLMGRLPTLMGRFTNFILRGRYAS